MDNPETHEWLGTQDPGAREANSSLCIHDDNKQLLPSMDVSIQHC
jgi:hypothetical protein